MCSAKRTTLCRALQSWFVALLYHTEISSRDVVPVGTKVSEFALGQWEGCDLLHGICLSRARLSASACHKVVTRFRLWRFP